MMSLRYKTLFLFIIAYISLFNFISARQETEVIIGVLAKRGTHATIERWSATADNLSRNIQGYTFRVVPLSFDELIDKVRTKEVDFILANSGYYVTLEKRFGVSRIATLENRSNESGRTTVFGGVIFTRKEREDINNFIDLKGKEFLAVHPRSFGGFQVAWRELHDAGIDPYQSFHLRFMETHDEVVYNVLEGRVDAGTVRTDTLERMGYEGKININDVKIIEPKHHKDFPYFCSTRLYPEWPFARSPHVSPQLSKKVATVLLQITEESNAARKGQYAGWTVPSNYQPVHDLLRTLHLDPYSRPPGIEEIWYAYSYWILGTFFFLLILSASITIVLFLNRELRRKEQELREARDNLEENVERRTTDLKIALNELEESRKQIDLSRKDWNDAFDAILDPIFIHDKDLRILKVNPAYEKRARLSQEEIEGRYYWEIFPVMTGPFASCSSFPEKLSIEGNEIELETGEIFISQSFGIKKADGSYVNAIHILKDITEEKKAYHNLQYRLYCESIVADIAYKFIEVDPRSIDVEAQNSLSKLGMAANVDRAYIVLYDQKTGEANKLFKWCSRNCRDDSSFTLHRYPDRFPWFKRQLNELKSIYIEDVDSLPAEANSEKLSLSEQHVKSLLSFPVFFSGKLHGAIVFDRTVIYSEWPREDRQILETAARILASALKRKDTERALIHSRSLLAEAEEITHIGNWEWNILTNGLYWSDEIFKIFGIGVDEFEATYDVFLSFVHPDDRGLVIDSVNSAIHQKKPYNLDHRIVQPNGSVKNVQVKGVVHYTANGEAYTMVGTIQDVTELRKSEIELKRLNRALMTLSKGNEVLVRADDEAKLIQDICTIIVNNGGYRMVWVGYFQSKADRSIVPQAFAGYTNGYFDADSLCMMDKYHENGPTANLVEEPSPVVIKDLLNDFRFPVWKDEALKREYFSLIALPLIVNGDVTGAITIHSKEIDIFDEREVELLTELSQDLAFGIGTIRARREKEKTEFDLRVSEKQFHELYDSAPNAYISVSALDGRISRCNRATMTMLGYDKDSILQKQIMELYAEGEDGKKKASEIFNRFKKGEIIRDQEMLMEKSDGTPLWVSLSVVPIYDDTGRIIESRSVAIDISRRKKAEHEKMEMGYKLQHSLVQTIRAISLTIEKRDPYTAGHQEKVSNLSLAIARKMGMSSVMCEGLRLSALIHDIGKIYVPAEYLNRPGKITKMEMSIIRTHPSVGYEILQEVDFPWPVAQTVYQHHEHLDGSGYPEGISGDDIIMEARILTVADVIEAIVHHRPYRVALPIDAAIEELLQNRGTYYDNDVVDTAIDMISNPEFSWDTLRQTDDF